MGWRYMYSKASKICLSCAIHKFLFSLLVLLELAFNDPNFQGATGWNLAASENLLVLPPI